MEPLRIEVMHAVKGRVRVRFSRPIKAAEMGEFLKKELGDTYFSYNAVIQTGKIFYSGNKALIEDILVRLAINYAVQYKQKQVEIKFKKEKNKLPAIACYSMAAILVDTGLNLVAFKGLGIRKAAKWINLATTVTAIFEHGYKEINEKGSFDPEVVSVMYLIDSINKDNTYYASMISWFATFGRHILGVESRELFLNIHSYEDCETKELLYQVEINKKKIETKMQALESVVFNCLKEGHLQGCGRKNCIKIN